MSAAPAPTPKYEHQEMAYPTEDEETAEVARSVASTTFGGARGAYDKASRTVQTYRRSGKQRPEEVSDSLREAVVAVCLNIVASTCGMVPRAQAERFSVIHGSLAKRGLISIWTEPQNRVEETLKGMEDNPTGHASNPGILNLRLHEHEEEPRRRAARQERREAEASTKDSSVDQSPASDHDLGGSDDDRNRPSYDALSGMESGEFHDVRSTQWPAPAESGEGGSLGPVSTQQVLGT
ncbi:hypothetical protein QFC20_007153 [Naganishia adeliensis]|uniref:Uncharacterized protein n=1 Tax=Naganishia adeliensis TaxID=92952 RepID=A0ACC2V320_9TREE|nr:hypothetical protein QFC20_007153 [Naganishia adeliensis]